MSKGKVNYENTIIYKLVHKEDFDNENIYIGSTTNFIKRKYAHKNRCNDSNDKEHNTTKYKYIRDNGGWVMWDMIEIEKYPCVDKRTSACREREWIEFYKSKLNTTLPFVMDRFVDFQEYQKKYREANKEKFKERVQKYYEDNKDQIKEKSKIYREENTEQIKEKQKMYREDNKDQIKEKDKKYRCEEVNKEYQKEYQKKYREQNKEKSKRYQKMYREEKSKKID